MTNSFRATDLPTTIDEVTARLQAANRSVLYALADLMTVFASHAELNGGDFVEIAGEKFQKLAALAGLPNVCADRARTWWRAVAEHRGLEHDGDYVLDTSSSASCQHFIDAGYYLTLRPGVGHDLTH